MPWVLALGLVTSPVALSTDTTPAGVGSAPRLLSLGVPVGFEANQGQSDARVRFLSRGAGYTLFLTPAEAVLSPATPAGAGPGGLASRRGLLRLRLVGADPDPEVEGVDPLPGRSHYFIGNDPRRWRTGIPHYARVRYREAYPGVDLVFHGAQGRLEYDLMVAPGADPSRIRVAYEGADAMRLDGGGHLVLSVGGGEVEQRAPAVSQEAGGARRAVPARYTLTGPREVGFELGDYDRSLALLIDPVLTYSSYLGGSGSDTGWAIAADGSGSAYVTGGTGSADFPLANPIQSTGYGAFVTKLSPAGDALVYSTYLVGSSGATGKAIALDASGSAYIAGYTTSYDFPVVNAFQPVRGGGRSYDGDAFAAKLAPDGSALEFSTYLGGDAHDIAAGVAADGTGV